MLQVMQNIVRGGSGLFSGRPPLVFLSNAIGNTGSYWFVDATDSNVG
jgi:hypothetical protein